MTTLISLEGDGHEEGSHPERGSRKHRVTRGADVGQMCWGALQTLDRLILREVKRQQLCISSIQALTREVDVLLLRLDATEGDELRHLASSRHEGVSTVAEVVVEHAAQERAQRHQHSSDSRATFKGP